MDNSENATLHSDRDSIVLKEEAGLAATMSASDDAHQVNKAQPSSEKDHAKYNPYVPDYGYVSGPYASGPYDAKNPLKLARVQTHICGWQFNGVQCGVFVDSHAGLRRHVAVQHLKNFVPKVFVPREVERQAMMLVGPGLKYNVTIEERALCEQRLYEYVTSREWQDTRFVREPEYMSGCLGKAIQKAKNDRPHGVPSFARR